MGSKESGPPCRERVERISETRGHPQSRHQTLLSLKLLKIRAEERPYYVELTFSQHIRCECRWVLRERLVGPFVLGNLSLAAAQPSCPFPLAGGDQGSRGPVAAFDPCFIPRVGLVGLGEGTLDRGAERVSSAGERQQPEGVRGLALY